MKRLICLFALDLNEKCFSPECFSCMAKWWDFTSSDVSPFFVVHSGTAINQNGGMHMVTRKEYRDLTVGDIYRNGKRAIDFEHALVWKIRQQLR